MPTPRTLLAAYLPTPGGEDALGLGVQLARSFHADLDVCMVLPPTPDGADVETAARLDSQAAEWLSDAAARVPDDVVAEAHIAFHDHAAEGLVVESHRTGSAAIIVGGSGGGIRGRNSLGSVVNDLMHVSTTPVVVAPLGARESASPITRITAAVGRRSGATPLLRAVIDGCERTGFPLRLISLLTPDGIGGQAGDLETAEKTAAEHLAELVETAKQALGADYDITSAVVTGDDVEDAAGKVGWHGGDIVFVGSSRLAQPLQLFLGATAAKMLRTLETVPMVVVPKDA